jgi:hypothetical protein
MSSDEHLETSSARRFTRFSLATMFVLVTAVAVAITVWMELSKAEVTAYMQIERSIAAAGWPREWSHEMNADEFDSFRRTMVELMRSKSLLTRMLRDPSISSGTFLARESDPVGWLERNLKFDFPKYTEVLRIRLLTHNQEDGVKIVNAVVNTYFKEVVEIGVQRRNRTEQRLLSLSDELKERIVREKKEVVTLASSLGADGASRHPEVEVREAGIRRLERELDELSHQLFRLQLEKQAPSRVQLLDEATVTP